MFLKIHDVILFSFFNHPTSKLTIKFETEAFILTLFAICYATQEHILNEHLTGWNLISHKHHLLQALHASLFRHQNLKLGRKVFPGRDLDEEATNLLFTPDCENICDPDPTNLLLFLAGLRTLTCGFQKHPFEFKKVFKKNSISFYVEN